MRIVRSKKCFNLQNSWKITGELKKISGLRGYALHFFCHMIQLIEIVSLCACFFAVRRFGGCFFSPFGIFGKKQKGKARTEN